MQKQAYSVEKGATRLALTLQKKYPVAFGSLNAGESYGLFYHDCQIAGVGGIAFFKTATPDKWNPKKPNLEFFKKHGVKYEEFQEIRETAFNHLQYVSFCKFLMSNLCAKAKQEFPIGDGDYLDMLRAVTGSFKAYETSYSMGTFDAQDRVRQIIKIMKAMEIIPPSPASEKFIDFAYSVKTAAREIHLNYAGREFHDENRKRVKLQDKNRFQAFHVMIYAGQFVETLFTEIIREI
ncbi:MAG: hypothetical protein NTV88_05700 [Candidatus Micrarchaeota archaeon]|nr:hypothetical protein [Candidatus Micrarchaeota archaeon]